MAVSEYGTEKSGLRLLRSRKMSAPETRLHANWVDFGDLGGSWRASWLLASSGLASLAGLARGRGCLAWPGWPGWLARGIPGSRHHAHWRVDWCILGSTILQSTTSQPTKMIKNDKDTQCDHLQCKMTETHHTPKVEG